MASSGFFDRLVVGTDGISNAANIVGMGLVIWGVTSEAHLGLAGASLAALLLLVVATMAWMSWISVQDRRLQTRCLCGSRRYGDGRGSAGLVFSDRRRVHRLGCAGRLCRLGGTVRGLGRGCERGGPRHRGGCQGTSDGCNS